MHAGIRALLCIAALLIYLGLRVLAFLRVDHRLLGWLAGGTRDLVADPVPVKLPH